MIWWFLNKLGVAPYRALNDFIARTLSMETAARIRMDAFDEMFDEMRRMVMNHENTIRMMALSLAKKDIEALEKDPRDSRSPS